ncbi:GNAT family N-acetyltransferase [Alicyclobacillus hesperidum]|uniref:GNAT family N-acetyltransferase n=1 Tax=Alicyclobacillus hesperidum TaxID=89784 RepID=UPI0024919D11|nr:GNAT family N-acetyltransferase [Alicyclobacillus hesperidum]
MMSGTLRLADGAWRLRPFNLRCDLPVAIRWYDAELVEWLEGTTDAPYDERHIVRMYTWLASRGHSFAIERRMGRKDWFMVGDVTLCKDMLPIVIGDSRWRGMGIGTMVIERLVRLATELGWSKLVAHKVLARNRASWRMFEKAGFVRIATHVDTAGLEYYVMERELDQGLAASLR